MFKFIKSIFAKENTSIADLYVQNDSKGEVRIDYVADVLLFTLNSLKSGENPDNKDEEVVKNDENISLQIKEIKDLKFLEKEITFTCSDKKYRLRGDNLFPLFEKLRPLVWDLYLFKAEKITYFVYNAQTRLFDPYPSLVSIRLYQDVLYYMRMEDEFTIIHFEEINTKTQYYMDQANLSFVWSTYSDEKFYTFCIKFENSLTFLEFRSKYIEFAYKSANKDTDYNNYFSGIGDVSINNDDESGQGISQDKKEDDTSDQEEDEEVLRKNTAKIKVENKDNMSNEHLIMSMGQCFVTRGSSLGVFDLSKDNLKFRTQIKNVLGNPQKIITHDGDTRLLILDKEKKNHIGLMDLARGEIVEKWEMNENINDYFDSVLHKNDSTLVGLSDRSLFRIDPRVKEKIVAKKEYKTKNEFSCGIATTKGNLAVASKKGDLRLYDKIDKRAKTLLPGFGSEVRGIDTSGDGSIILCTCKSYILVFTVDSNYAKNSKDAVPRRLQLKPQHSTLLQDEISFTTAKFDQDDTIIITSTGRFVIKWKIYDILKGNLYNYSIKELSEKVIDEDFIVNGQDIVVALKNDVRKMTEKDLKKPGF